MRVLVTGGLNLFNEVFAGRLTGLEGKEVFDDQFILPSNFVQGCLDAKIQIIQ